MFSISLGANLCPVRERQLHFNRAYYTLHFIYKIDVRLLVMLSAVYTTYVYFSGSLRVYLPVPDEGMYIDKQSRTHLFRFCTILTTGRRL